MRQKHAKGLGDAIMCHQNNIGDEPFTVLLGHSVTKSKIPCTKQLINTHEKYCSSTVALTQVTNINKSRLIDGTEIENGIYKITDITERILKENPPSNLAVMGRCILTPDIFDKIGKTEVGFGGEIHLTDALKKLDSLYGVVFEGKSYYLSNRLEWLKASIEFGLDDEEFRDDLLGYMKSYI